MRVHQSNTTEAASQVISVVLVVAITIVLSAVVGSLLLDTAGNNTKTASNADVSISVEETSDGIRAQVITGSADNLTVLKNGEVIASTEDVGPGTVISVSPTDPGDEISFVTSNNGERKLITTRTTDGQEDSSISFNGSDVTFTQA